MPHTAQIGLNPHRKSDKAEIDKILKTEGNPLKNKKMNILKTPLAAFIVCLKHVEMTNACKISEKIF